MTRMTNNILISLLSGKIGKLVFWKYGNKITAGLSVTPEVSLTAFLFSY
jgi:hypothetical protein